MQKYQTFYYLEFFYFDYLSFLLLLQMHQVQVPSVDRQDLAIIITTSPIKNNPATDVIDMAISSIYKEPSLINVTIFVICDGVKVNEQGGSKYKSGIVSELSNQHYEQFKSRLREKYKTDSRMVIEQRTERCGFAENIRYVMSNIPHQFVLIFQHDHVLCRPCDFSAIIKVMKTHPINYIGMMNKSVRKLPYQLDQHMGMRKYFSKKVGYHPTKVRHDHQEFRRKVEQYYLQLYGLPLMPLLFWYDKVHVARKSYYLDVIFNPYGFLDEVTQTYIKTVTFVQDSFGCFMRKSIRHRPSRFEELSAFIFWDAENSTIFHTHGRGFLTQQEKVQKHQQFLRNKGQNSESQSSEKYQDQHELNLDFMQQDQ